MLFTGHGLKVVFMADPAIGNLIAVGIAMAIQENGTDSLDYFAMLRGWGLARK